MDYVKLSISRGTQLDRHPAVCELAEFDLLLPCSSYDGVFVYMTPQAGLGAPQQGCSCPRGRKRCDAVLEALR